MFHVNAHNDIPDHYFVVSHALSWLYGTEFVVRFNAESEAKAKEEMELFADLISSFKTMQETAKFRPFESAEIMIPHIPWKKSVHGTQGCMILEDKLLHGTNYAVVSTEESDFNEDGPLHKDYWPQHFLIIHLLRPSEYVYTLGLKVRSFCDAILSMDPYSILTLERNDYMDDSILGPMLDHLKQMTPSRLMVNNIQMDLRVRKTGNEVDLVVGGRWMAPILEGLQQAFDKQAIPLNTYVTVESDSKSSYAMFSCHDKYNKLISPETAYFEITPLQYQNPNTGKTPKLSIKQQREYCLIPPGQLWKKKKLIRMIQVEFFLPAEMMSQMIHTVRDKVFGPNTGTWDPSENPFVIEWSHFFPGINGLSGFVLDENESRIPYDGPTKFRFICAGLEYFEDEKYIDDDGNFKS